VAENRTAAFVFYSPMEILTVAEVAALLKLSKSQIYEMTNKRTRTGSIRENPIPCLKIGGSVRFRKSDIEAWLEKLVVRGK
jgi:excisionase family DNA binding protein